LIPAYVLGIASTLTPDGSVVPVIVVLVATIWGFFIHANMRMRLGPLEWLISTALFHHWHRTTSTQRDRNYASMLPWIDRLFGTHYLPDAWPESYGIDLTFPCYLNGN
jgi:sterol desaturase/sphingolipid hydroxylase (fatty acid hydroxylase superfamily)